MIASGYLALPAERRGRPVLLLHAWWGLNDTVRDFCKRLADAGHVTFAPDLYRGRIATTVAEAERLADGLSAYETELKTALDSAVGFLTGYGSSTVAVVGFSLGAYFALELSNSSAGQIDSVVLFYGTGPNDFSSAQAAYLGHFAAEDPYESDEYVAATERALGDADRPVTFFRYPQTGHWFCEPDRADAYNRDAAELAWRRTLDFLAR